MADISIPCSKAKKDPAWGAEALVRLRTAALADPEGGALDKAFAALSAPPAAAAAE
ncbi:MAG: hypothetical protein HOI96_14975 [Rhodospirillaceae bacterium]|nr:hypothetical protein [Rhodospirillaceae bacterium]